MRMSCNGCRVLRKGCSEDCSIRPCLQWITNPEAQANATVFLAKFYGRAGLMNLINAGPDNLRPAIFRSLLYEACGRVVNPIYGSVGLLWSGSWQMCQAAVEAVLKGSPIMQIPSETAANTPSPPLKAYDIRHVSKDEGKTSATAASSGKGFRPTDLHKVSKTTRTKFKRPGNGSVDKIKRASNQVVGSSSGGGSEADADVDGPDCQSRWRQCYPDDCHGAPSHGSSASHDSTVPATATVVFGKNDSGCHENESSSSEQTAEAEPENQDDHLGFNTEVEIELELTLGLDPTPQGSRTTASQPSPPKRCEKRIDSWDSSSDLCRIDLGLDLTAC